MTLEMTAPLEIGLVVRDLGAALTFYRDALGLVLVADVAVPAEKADQAMLSSGGYQVVRLQTPRGERIKLLCPDRAPDPAPVATDRILDRSGAGYVTFIVGDLRAIVARLVEHGATPLTGTAPVEVRPGTYLAFLRDPDGHIIEIVEYADIAAYRPDLADPAP